MSKYNVGDIVTTNTYGDIEILNIYYDESEKIGDKNYNYRHCNKCDVRFLSNNQIVYGVKIYNLNRGRIFNPTHGFIPNKIFQSNTSGPFIMLEHLGTENGYAKVKIKFINTGRIIDVDLKNALEGRISDPALNGKTSNDFKVSRFDDYHAYILSRLKATYWNMMARCYDNRYQFYINYGAIGVTVCDRWKDNIDNFLNDAKNLFNYESYFWKPYLYTLDKDWKSFNNGIPKSERVYSPETCVWLHYMDNSNLARIEARARGEITSEYFGILKSGGKTKDPIFIVNFNANGNQINIGSYSNIIAAANAYNYYYLQYHTYEFIPLINDVPYMPPDEFMKYKIN